MPALRTRRALLQGVLLLAGSAGLAGCGFHPVYMPTASGKAGPAQREMAAVRVGLIPDRPGQELRQALQQRLGSDSGAEPARYELAVSYTIAGEGIAIDPNSNPTRVRLIAHANWSLTSIAPGHAPVTSGAARAFDAINMFDQQYFAADLETEAAQRRLANAIASEIAEQLAVFFRRRAGLG